MKVIVYSALAIEGDQAFDGPPNGEDFVSRIRMPMPERAGKFSEGWHPVIFTAATARAAYDKAHAWYNTELAKEIAKRKSAEAMRDKIAATKLIKKVPKVELVEA